MLMKIRGEGTTKKPSSSSPKKNTKWGWTNQRTAGPTDTKVSYRVATAATKNQILIPERRQSRTASMTLQIWLRISAINFKNADLSYSVQQNKNYKN